MKMVTLRAWRGPVLAVLAAVGALAVTACGSTSQTGSASSSGSSSAAEAAPANGSSSSSSAAGSGHKVTLTIGYIGTQGIFTGPEGFAYSKGLLQRWLAPYGVSIAKTAGFANGPLLTAALVGGSVDVGTIGDTPALIAKSQGAPTKIINQNTVGIPAWIIAKPSIHSLSQLSGKGVARQQASYMDRYLQGLLAQNGLQGKVPLISMLLAQAIPAFNAGSLNALVLQPTQIPLVKGQYNVLAKSESTPALEGTSVTEATQHALSQDADLPAQWNAVRAKAITYAKAHLAEYYAFSAKAGQTSPALYAKYEPISTVPDQAFTSAGVARLQSTLKFLVGAHLAKSFSIQSWEAH